MSSSTTTHASAGLSSAVAAGGGVASTLNMESGSLLGHYIAVMSPVGGPSFLSRWQQGVQVFPLPSGRSRCGSDATVVSTNTSHGDSSSYLLEQQVQHQLAWVMRLLLLDCSPPHARIREDHIDIQVNSAIRIIEVSQIDLVCLCLSWREQATDEANEFSVPMFCAVFYLHIRFAERLHALFPTIRDRLEILLRRILFLMDSIEQTGEEAAATGPQAGGNICLSCTDPRLAQVWDPEMVRVGACIEQWVAAKVDRLHLELSLCQATVLRELALPPRQSRYSNGTLQSVVSTAMSYHRCIIVSDNAEEALRWVRTICLFLSDEQLQQSTLKVASNVDQIVPDARIQGLLLEPLSTPSGSSSSPASLSSSAAFAESLARKLVEFRYPVAVINVRRHANASEHIVPESLSTVMSLKRYREQRFEALCNIDSKSNFFSSSTTAKLSMSPLRKVSSIVAAFMFQLQKIVESVNNTALRESRTFTNRSSDSSGGGAPLQPPPGTPANPSSTALSSLFNLLTPRQPAAAPASVPNFTTSTAAAGNSSSSHGGSGGGAVMASGGEQTRSVDSLEASGGANSSATLTPPLAPSIPAPPSSLVSPLLPTTNNSTFTSYSAYSVDHTEAARWDFLAARHISPLMQRWRHSMLLRAVQHAFLEMDKYVRNAVPAVPEEDTDLLCCLMERIPLELAEHRVHQAIQTISSRMKAF